MRNVTIICVGKLKEKYLTAAISEYSKRISAFCRFTIVEVDEEKISDNPSDAQITAVLDAEGKRILQKIPSNSLVVSMCIEGESVSSKQLSSRIEREAVCGKSSMAFVIGGSWGLSEAVKERSDWKLSMSKMTFPHQLARVMLCEQIYRAFQIMNNGKYHK